MSLVTRYAPSPTGYLHLGHVVNAIYVWGLAALFDARVLLRLEDHDRIRCRPQFEQALLQDLTWLGFIATDPEVTRQSDRHGVYAAALERLQRSHHVYYCDCSRRLLGAGPYSGRCRHRGLAAGPGRGIRLTMPPEEGSGDLLLRDRDGNWTYQFAVTVDDMDQGVTLVIRGADLLPSTARQQQLARMLGRTQPPVFLHHPLVRKPGGEKLSKASNDTGIRELRAGGMSAAEVIGRAAAAVGLLAAPSPVAAAAVVDLFRETAN